MFDSLADSALQTEDARLTQLAVAAEDDGPPTAGEGSYPRDGDRNPVRAARESGGRRGGEHDEKLYAVSVKASRNNTIVTFARPKGDQFLTLSGGKVGFKKSNRNGYEAGYQCATSAFKVLEEALAGDKDAKWQLYLNGFGPGREAIQKAITASEGHGLKRRLVRVIDKTPIKIGGTRSKKMKRL